MFIDMHFCQWDDEKYRNLATMLLNNYQQALQIMTENCAALEQTLRSHNITINNLDRWQDEQVVYFETLGQELAEDIHRIMYVDLLQQLRATK